MKYGRAPLSKCKKNHPPTCSSNSRLCALLPMFSPGNNQGGIPDSTRSSFKSNDNPVSKQPACQRHFYTFFFFLQLSVSASPRAVVTFHNIESNAPALGRDCSLTLRIPNCPKNRPTRIQDPLSIWSTLTLVSAQRVIFDHVFVLHISLTPRGGSQGVQIEYSQ